MTLPSLSANAQTLAFVLAEPTEAKYRAMDQKAIVWGAMQKVCLAAAFVLMTTVSYSMIVGATISFAATLICMASTAVFIGCANFSAARMERYRTSAAIDRGIHRCFLRIAHWSPKDIVDFFEQNRLPLKGLPMEVLTAMDSKQQPLKRLLPLIARFHYWQQIGRQLFEKATAFIEQASAINDPKERPSQLSIGFDYLERDALTACFNAAAYLQQIARPYLLPLLDDPKVRPAPDRYENLYHFTGQAPLTLRVLSAMIQCNDYAALRLALFGELEDLARLYPNNWKNCGIDTEGGV